MRARSGVWSIVEIGYTPDVAGRSSDVGRACALKVGRDHRRKPATIFDCMDVTLAP